MKRFEEIGTQIMNRTRGSADFGGDPIASVLQSHQKQVLAAQILGQAFATASNFIVANKDSVEKIADAVIERQELLLHYARLAPSLLNAPDDVDVALRAVRELGAA